MSIEDRYEVGPLTLIEPINSGETTIFCNTTYWKVGDQMAVKTMATGFRRWLGDLCGCLADRCGCLADRLIRLLWRLANRLRWKTYTAHVTRVEGATLTIAWKKKP